MGGLVVSGREKIVGFIRAAIECCSKAHHMNTNIEVAAVAGNRVRVHSKFSAWHVGRKQHGDTMLQVLGTYTDEFVHTADGWRIQQRTERTHIELWSELSNKTTMAEFFADAFELTNQPAP